MLPLSCPQRFKFKPLSTALLFSVFLSTDVYASCVGDAAWNYRATGGSVCNFSQTDFYGANVISASNAGSTVNISAPAGGTFVNVMTTAGAATRTVSVLNGGVAKGASVIFKNTAYLWGTVRNSFGRTILMQSGSQGPLTDSNEKISFGQRVIYM